MLAGISPATFAASAAGTVGAVVLGAVLNQVGQAIASRRTERFTRAESERHLLFERLAGLEETAIRQGQALAELFGIVGRPPGMPFTRRGEDLMPPIQGRSDE